MRHACDLRGSPRLGQEDGHELEANLGYRVKFCLKHKEEKKEKVKIQN